MGCVNSRTDINDLHPNIFQVMNVDDQGNLITPGRLEVTESDIVLYQRGKQPIKWPLRCLRRYGYDAEIFSFESGRRCSTGPGIYAFKCRRAEHLFNLVQTNIQVCNNGGEDMISRSEHPAASHPVNPTTATRVTIPVEPNYLDPILSIRAANNRGGNHRSIVDHRNHQNQGTGRLDSVGSGTASLVSPQYNSIPHISQSPASPPVLPPPPPPPPLLAIPLSPSHPSSLYVNEEISLLPLDKVVVERNNNRKSLQRAIQQRSCTVSNAISNNGGGSAVFPQEVTPRIDKISDIAPPTVGSPPPISGTGTYMNIAINSDVSLLLSPSHNSVPDATTTTQAIITKEDTNRNTENAGHAYMNISPGQERTAECVGSGRPSCPPTLLSVQSPQQEALEEATRHCYANLEPSEIETLRKRFSGASVSEKSSPLPPSTPTTTTMTGGTALCAAIREVNYAVLDLDTKDAPTTAAAGSPLDGPPNSTATPPPPAESPNRLQQQQQQKGYATIDFNKTAALSHSVKPNLNVNDNEGSRKTRHNSTISALTVSASSSSSTVRRSSSVSE